MRPPLHVTDPGEAERTRGWVARGIDAERGRGQSVPSHPRGGPSILPPKNIRVGVAEGQSLARRGLVHLLDSTSDIEVTDEAEDGEAAVAFLQREEDPPDVVVLDLRMPKLDGLEATRRIRDAHPNVRIVILTANEDSHLASEAVKAGANAYVLRTALGEEVVETVRMVARGHVVVDQSVIDSLDAPSAGVSGGLTLSDRERDVLVLIARGLTNRAIAEQLGISIETVKTHLERLYRRLGVAYRTDAVAKGLREGLIE